VTPAQAEQLDAFARELYRDHPAARLLLEESIHSPDEERRIRAAAALTALDPLNVVAEVQKRAIARSERGALRLVEPDKPRAGLSVVSFATLAEEGRRLLADGVPYVVEGLIPDLGMAGFMVAPPKAGKSTLGLLMACAIARGDPAFLGRYIRQKRTLYLALEDPREYLAVMIAQAAKGGENAAAYTGYLPLDPATLDRIEGEVRAGKYEFVYVATWTSWVAGAVGRGRAGSPRSARCAGSADSSTLRRSPTTWTCARAS
jgi:hypothetical protein